jgi:hypothetical protein
MTQGIVFWKAAFAYPNHTTDARDDTGPRDLDSAAWPCDISGAFHNYAHYEMTAGEHITRGDNRRAADADAIAGQRLNRDTWGSTMFTATHLILSRESSGLL